MIISDTYKYVFLETPRTGSSAIAKELCELYDGQKAMRKHSNYYDFLKNASASQKDYLVFAGVRNPLDSVVSKYTKYKNNHRGRYTDPNWLKKNGGWVSPEEVKRFKFVQTHEFEDYIHKFYKTPFINTLNLHSAACSHIIRFENLNEDFVTVLKSVGISPQRPLPVVNKTSKSPVPFESYFNTSLQSIAIQIFGPYMKEWGYDMPTNWIIGKPSKIACTLYKSKVILARAYCYISAKPNIFA